MPVDVLVDGPVPENENVVVEFWNGGTDTVLLDHGGPWVGALIVGIPLVRVMPVPKTEDCIHEDPELVDEDAVELAGIENGGLGELWEVVLRLMPEESGTVRVS